MVFVPEERSMNTERNLNSGVKRFMNKGCRILKETKPVSLLTKPALIINEQEGIVELGFFNSDGTRSFKVYKFADLEIK
jgi:hypothetical protein